MESEPEVHYFGADLAEETHSDEEVTSTVQSSDHDMDVCQLTESESDGGYEDRRQLPGSAHVNRYWLDQEEAGPTCFNCGQRGHVSRECKETNQQPCYLCGEPGHNRSDCPQEMCFNCWRPGHHSRDCREQRRRRVRDDEYCNHCQQAGHLRSECPLRWRRYLLKRNPSWKPRDHQAWCCYCAAQGHWTDDCPARERLVHSIYHRFNHQLVKLMGLDTPDRQSDNRNDRHDRHDYKQGSHDHRQGNHGYRQDVRHDNSHSYKQGHEHRVDSYRSHDNYRGQREDQRSHYREDQRSNHSGQYNGGQRNSQRNDQKHASPRRQGQSPKKQSPMGERIVRRISEGEKAVKETIKKPEDVRSEKKTSRKEVSSHEAKEASRMEASRKEAKEAPRKEAKESANRPQYKGGYKK